MNIRRLVGGAGLLVSLSAVAFASDNTTLNSGAGGDVIRTVDKSSKKAQVMVLDLGGSGTESLASPIGVEDAAETGGGPLWMCGTVRRDTKASSAGTTGDNATLNTDANGGLWLAADVVEDAAETAGGTLVGIGTVRRDTKASSAGTTGDNATLNTDANGGLWLAADVIEDAAETAGAPLVGIGTVRRDTAASSAGTTGDNATLNTDANGKLWVTGSVVEDAAEADGQTLLSMGSVRRDTMASSAGTTGDNATINTDARGAVYTVASPHGAFVSGVITVTTAGTSVQGASNTVKQCFFGAAPSNTGNCFIGQATGDNRNKGLVVIKGSNSVGPVLMSNTNLAWGDCATNGDVITWFCTN